MPRNLVVLELFAQPLHERGSVQFGDGEQHRLRALRVPGVNAAAVLAPNAQRGGLDLGRADPEASRLVDVVASSDEIQEAVVVEIPVVTTAELDEQVVGAVETPGGELGPPPVAGHHICLLYTS